MLFVAAASAASSPCAGSSLFFCEDFGAGRDGWVEGRGDAKQFASHKHPWPASVAKADDAGVLLDRRLGAGVLGKALPKAVRMSEVPLSLSFELTGVNAFDEEEREVGMLLHPMTCYGATSSTIATRPSGRRRTRRSRTGSTPAPASSSS